jgi:hypothetical protein
VTGYGAELPDLPGLRERWARDVLHCPYCHGHEVRDRALGVIGGTIDQLVIDGSDQLRGVQLDDGCVIPRDALFVPPRFVPNNILLLRLGCGSAAAIALNADLVDDDVRNAVRDLEHGFPPSPTARLDTTESA